MHLLEAGNTKVLLDCGLYQGRREEARQRNSHFPFHPHQIDAVIVSHAHIDHCGNLPTLVRQGFAGPIYCTPPTRDLLRIMLSDSAKIQEEDAAHLNIVRNYAEPWVQPLYTHHDVDRALRQVVAVPYEHGDANSAAGCGSGSSRPGTSSGRPSSTSPPPARTGRGRSPSPATSAGGTCRFSSRPPRSRRPTCWSARAPTATGCTSSIDETVEKLYAVVRETVDRDGKVLIPAFSLGRTQLIIHILQQGLRDGPHPAGAGLRGQPARGGRRRRLPGPPEQPRTRRSAGPVARGARHPRRRRRDVRPRVRGEHAADDPAGAVRRHRLERHVRRRADRRPPEADTWTTRAAASCWSATRRPARPAGG